MLSLRDSGTHLGPTLAVGSVPVLRLSSGEMSVVDQASSVTEAAGKMAAEVLAAGDRLRAGLSVADPGTRA